MDAAPIVLISEGAPPALLEGLRRPDHPGPPPLVRYRPDLADRPEQLAEQVLDAAALVVRNRTRVDAQLLAQAANLRVIGRLGAGLDNIDLEAASRRGVAIVYAPFANSVSVAEHALCLLLALAKRLPLLDAGCRQGRWERRIGGLELRGRTLGILGFGAVGRHLARMAAGLGLQIIAHHPRRPPDHPDFGTLGVQWVDEETLLRRAELLSVHLPARDETFVYLNEERLRKLPPGALLVNTGRGTVIDEAALVRVLADGHLGGAALDVRAQEPPPQPDPLARFDNVILTPHAAGLTEDAQARVGAQVAEDIRRVLAGWAPLRPALVPGHRDRNR